LWDSKEYGLNRFICEQPSYNLLDRRVERELIPMAQTYGIAVIPYSPVAGGFLTGRYQRDMPAPSDSRFDKFWKGARERHYAEAAFSVLDLVVKLSKEKDCSPYQLALAWCAQQPGVTSPIIGPRTKAHLDDALGAVDMQLTAEDLKQIDAVAPPGRAVVPYYGYDGMAWVTWGPHKFRW
jgi:aryl-alcohol dehydrogenase-like predicted oxidoreductase